MAFNINGVEIFAAGTHRGKKYTLQDLDNMVEAFNEAGFIPPLKLGHTEKQSILQNDGLPAAGWVKRLFRKGEKLLADFVNIPPKIFKSIKDGEYRQVSIELWSNFPIEGKILPRVLKAVALLGQDIPQIPNLKPIMDINSIQVNGVEGLIVEAFNFETDMTRVEFKEEKEETNEFELNMSLESIKLLLFADEGISFDIGRMKSETITEVQIVIFTKDKWTQTNAKVWLENHNLKFSKIDETDTSFRFRQREPNEFKEGSFRTITPGTPQEEKNKKKGFKKMEKEDEFDKDKFVKELDTKMEKFKSDMDVQKEEYTKDVELKTKTIQDLEAKLAKMEINTRNTEVKNFIKEINSGKEKKITPAIEPEVYALLSTLANFPTSQVVKFSDSEKKSQELNIYELGKRVFSNLPTSIVMGELSEDDPNKKGDQTNMSIDDRLDKKIQEVAKADKMTYSEAYSKVMSDPLNANLANEYRNKDFS